MTARQRAEIVKRLATEVGFDRVGIAPVAAPPHADFLRQWLGRGYAGRMTYLHRHVELRLDPRRLLPGVQSIICVAMNYHRPEPLRPESGRDNPSGTIASYAWGPDYHELIRNRLDTLLARLGEALDEPFDARPFVDTAPVLERSLASAAGLGWIGKNTCLIAPKLGSFVFLAGAATTLPLEIDPPVPDRCGRCRRCLDACPTGALVEPYVLDASRCISYLTIELRDAIPPDLRPAVGDRVFGCDVCQRVCPHNRKAPGASEPVLQAGDSCPEVPLPELLNWSRPRYLEATRHRATRRAKLAMFRRNAAVALANIGGPQHLDLLRAAAHDEDPLLAEHAQWAIRHIQARPK
ncbi:MAG: tRNA epoxyqueuosine(34) reductase QueG [Phycisphaerae bacterium]|nr:tRNA epoxyqueuosine(34) reductase QueG [Phycisphaerae bacterium]